MSVMAHREMRAKKIPFPYEDGPRAVMGVNCKLEWPFAGNGCMVDDSGYSG